MTELIEVQNRSIYVDSTKQVTSVKCNQRKKLEHDMTIEYEYLKQQVRVKWLLDGD